MTQADKLTTSELQMVLGLQANVTLTLRMKDDIEAKLARHSTDLKVAMELLRLKYSADGMEVTDRGEWVRRS